ncbi:MAG: hypothetical protein KF712_16130 [Akkermansiaceae bacterium]|nr:hypothetical protein [Akkermansiaceae bacterium]
MKNAIACRILSCANLFGRPSWGIAAIKQSWNVDSDLDLIKKLGQVDGSFTLPLKLLAAESYAKVGKKEILLQILSTECTLSRVDGLSEMSLYNEIRCIHRSGMTREALNQAVYGKRWHIESFIGGMKRLCGSALTARLDITQRHETLLRLLAYTLYR